MERKHKMPNQKKAIGPTAPVQPAEGIPDGSPLVCVRVVSTAIRMAVESRDPGSDLWREFASVSVTIRGQDKMDAGMVSAIIDAVRAQSGDGQDRVVARVIQQVRAVRTTTIIRD